MKQEIRQKFANEITKYFKKLQTEKESASTINKTLYFILILTISLTSCNEQQQNVKLSQSITFNSSISSITSLTQPSDLEQALLTVSSLLLSKQTAPECIHQDLGQCVIYLISLATTTGLGTQ